MSKTVQKSGAQPAVRQDSHAVYPTHYSVKIHSLRPEGSCRATASVNINGCFAVRGIKVMDSSKGLFVSMPSYRAGNGEYKDICFPAPKRPEQSLIRLFWMPTSRLLCRPKLRIREVWKRRTLPRGRRMMPALP